MVVSKVRQATLDCVGSGLSFCITYILENNIPQAITSWSWEAIRLVNLIISKNMSLVRGCFCGGSVVV